MDEASPFAIVEQECCTPATGVSTLHEDLTSLLDIYDVNEAAASVKVYAIKPGAKL